MEKVIVERVFAAPVRPAEVAAVASRTQGCLDLHGVRHLSSFLSRDGRRMVCLFEAPDAEAVRRAQRNAGLAFERVWTASVHGPPQPR